MKIYHNTVSDILWEYLKIVMSIEELSNFRLVGGTALSLQLGHRKSVDIDLFTDAMYGSIDFNLIDSVLIDRFKYVDSLNLGVVGMGKSYFIGNNLNELVKLDIFYSENFVFPQEEIEGIRLSKIEEIAAMKLDVIGRGGRKKDFWDIHELLSIFSLDEMIGFYDKRYPYNFTRDEILTSLTDYDTADNDFEPICLKNKVWELIKLDLSEAVKKLT